MPEILIDIKELYEGEQAKIKNILVYISKVLGARSIIICHPEHLQWVRGISGFFYYTKKEILRLAQNDM